MIWKTDSQDDCKNRMSWVTWIRTHPVQLSVILSCFCLTQKRCKARFVCKASCMLGSKLAGDGHQPNTRGCIAIKYKDIKGGMTIQLEIDHLSSGEAAKAESARLFDTHLMRRICRVLQEMSFVAMTLTQQVVY